MYTDKGEGNAFYKAQGGVSIELFLSVLFPTVPSSDGHLAIFVSSLDQSFLARAL